MRSAIVSISALLLGVALFMLGNGMLGTLLSIRLTAAGVSPMVTGTVLAGYFAGLAAGSVLAMRFISQVGHIRAFSAFASIFSVAALGHAFFPTAWLWGVLRLIEGFAIAGLFMCAESWLNERSTNAQRGKVMSIYMIVIYLAQGVGQLMLNVADHMGFGLFALVSAFLSLAVVPVALTRTPAPPIPIITRLGLRALYRISPLGVFGCFTSGMILGAFYSLGPAYAQLTEPEVAATARFMSAAIFGGLLMQWPIGILSDRFDRRRVILALYLMIAASSAVLIQFAPAGMATRLGAVFVFGALVFVLYPQSVSHANDYARGENFVGIAAGLILAYSIGAIAGPIAASAAMNWLGPTGLFVFIFAVCVIAAGFTMLRMRQRAAPAAEDRSPFTAMPRTTPMLTELDPRTDPAAPELDATPQKDGVSQ